MPPGEYRHIGGQPPTFGEHPPRLRVLNPECLLLEVQDIDAASG